MKKYHQSLCIPCTTQEWCTILKGFGAASRNIVVCLGYKVKSFIIKHLYTVYSLFHQSYRKKEKCRTEHISRARIFVLSPCSSVAWNVFLLLKIKFYKYLYTQQKKNNKNISHGACHSLENYMFSHISLIIMLFPILQVRWIFYIKIHPPHIHI